MSCGKKAQTEKVRQETVVSPVTTETTKFLDKQVVVCEGTVSCPNNIAKLVIFDRSKINYCTGFLVADDILATSATCLPSYLRLRGQDCSRDVFLFFPRSASLPTERLGCVEVLQVSPVNLSSDPLLWRDNLTFLKIKPSKFPRRDGEISRSGFSDARNYTIWSIEQIDEYSALLKRQACEATHGSYINPLVSNDFSPQMLMSGCDLEKGMLGAPAFDIEGKIRGIVSEGIDEGLKKAISDIGLLTKPLKEMFHLTNFSCAPTLTSSDVADIRECYKELSYTKIDKLRSDMLSTTGLYFPLKKKLEESLNAQSPYFKFKVKLNNLANETQETEIEPSCFKPFSDWLSTLDLYKNIFVVDQIFPKFIFKKSMDPYGRVKGISEFQSESQYYLQFSLRSIRSGSKSQVLMWNETQNLNFPNVSEACF